MISTSNIFSSVLDEKFYFLILHIPKISVYIRNLIYNELFMIDFFFKCGRIKSEKYIMRGFFSATTFFLTFHMEILKIVSGTNLS